ncbi:hypothetical protein TrRE_jg1777, partial [Triparma retinervis]
MLPNWDADPADAAKNDQSFATASDLSLNTSVHRRGSLLSSMALGTLGIGNLAQRGSKIETSGAPLHPSSSSRASSASQPSSSRSVTSTVSSGSRNSNSVQMVNDDLPNAYFSTLDDAPPASSYIGEQHFWDNQKSRLQATDQQLAVSSAMNPNRGSPGSAIKDKRRKKKKKASERSGTGSSAMNSNSRRNASSAAAPPTPSTTNPSHSSSSMLSTSPIETTGGRDSTLNTTANNNENRPPNSSSSTRAAPRPAPSPSSSPRKVQPPAPEAPAHGSISFGMPERFSTHRRERSEMSGAAEVEEVGCEDFVSFLTSGLEQMIASIEALVISEQSTAAVIYRDKPLTTTSTTSTVAPTHYDPAAITRLRNFASSYLTGGGGGVGGELLFGRSTMRRKANSVPGGRLGRSLGDLRNVTVDVINNALNLCEAARRGAAIERRQCKKHLQKIQAQAKTHAKKLLREERGKRKKLEGEKKTMREDMMEEMEGSVNDKCVGYEVRLKETEDEMRTLSMENSYLKNEMEKKREESENAVEYAKYRAKADADASSGETVKRLEAEIERLKRDVEDGRRAAEGRVREIQEKERERTRGEVERSKDRCEELASKLRESEARREENERNARRVLGEEVAKLRKKHEDAVDGFRKENFDVNSNAGETVKRERESFKSQIEMLRSEHAQEMDTMRAALELTKSEGRERERIGREEEARKVGREEREQIRALTMAHEAEMRRAGKEVVRLQKLLRKKGVSDGGGGDGFVQAQVESLRMDREE